MQYLQGALLLGGLLLVALAYGRYIRRTGDWSGVLRFWARGMALSVVEFKIQRAGLMVLMLAVVVRFCQVLFQW
ncbi:hypothetical protein ACLD02_04490 [Alloalcanivorax sp. C16-2]|uniref:hypothetical protein n=1 Tax=Alloalcanivorax TaxID=3020832 RepID=UPI00193180F9|nr:hypothetical protein [Alloalcanivorax marinus]MBL7250461.1 hypothetical protein [Alloalcanivorax marinus]